jgi:uncharacterized protein
MRPARPTSRSPETIVVFAREPIAGTTKTRLIPRLGANHAAALARAFMLDTIAKARATGRRVVIAGDAPHGVKRSVYFRQLALRFDATLIDQGDGTLGVRMRRTLAPFCSSGAVLIGTDIPSLPATRLGQSFALLRQSPVILGPSVDGGYYLLGVRGALPDIFRGLRWGNSGVLAQTISRLRGTGTDYALIDGWYDVDRWSDLLVLAAELHLMPRARTHPCPATAQTLERLGLL